MKPLLHSPIVCAAILVIAVAHSPAFAQATGATRPYRAIFGGSTPNPDVHHSFDVTALVLGGYEDNAPVVFEPGASPLLQSGTYLGASGGVAYSWQGKRVQVGANAGGDTRYYRDTAELIETNRYGSIGFTAELGRRNRIFANQSVSYAPSYLYSLIPGLPVAPGAAVGGGTFPVGDHSVYVYDTKAAATIGISRRGSIEALARYRLSDFGDFSEATLTALRSYSVGARYRYDISRYASLRLGYEYGEGQYRFGQTNANAATGVHDIDVGVDYRRPLSLTRRTTIDFRTGSSIVTVPMTGSDSSELQYRIVGEVGLSHEMGRTWLARIGYDRGIGFAEAFAEPVFADAFSASLTGFLARRTDFSANGWFSIGGVGLDASTTPGASSSSFQTWNVSTRVRSAVSSMWAVYAVYMYYSQDLGNAAIVPTGVPSVLDRHTVQVGLMFSGPLLRRSRAVRNKHTPEAVH